MKDEHERFADDARTTPWQQLPEMATDAGAELAGIAASLRLIQCTRFHGACVARDRGNQRRAARLIRAAMHFGDLADHAQGNAS